MKTTLEVSPKIIFENHLSNGVSFLKNRNCFDNSSKLAANTHSSWSSYITSHVNSLIYFHLACQVVSGSPIKQDEPLLLNYGCLNNDLFLLDYGFVIPSNPYDCIELKYDGALLDAASMAAGVSSSNFSSPAPWQQQILSQLNLDGGTPDLKVSCFPHNNYALYRFSFLS